MAVTINDVAKRAGVSIKTVSRVINNEPAIADGTRQKVQKAIDELGYVPNLWAKRLRSGHSGMITLLFNNATPSYLMDVINGLIDCGIKYHYSINLYRLNINDPKEINYVLSTAEQKQVEGFVITPPVDNSIQLINGLYAMNFPFVQLTPRKRTREHAWIAATDEQGEYEAVRYLLTLGHRRIGFIQGDVDHQASWDRLNGFKRAIQEAELEMADELLRQGSWTFEAGLREARGLLSLPDPPSAIVAANDQAAAGVIQAAWEFGIRCPEELSVIGFDDVPLAKELTPPLTTTRQPIFEIAKQAMKVLVEKLIPRTGDEISIHLPTELIIRSSTAKYAG